MEPVLGLLQSAWEKGGTEGQKDLRKAEGLMFALGPTAVELMKIPIAADKGNYGPTFQIS
jgi:hypothetical protein